MSADPVLAKLSTNDPCILCGPGAPRATRLCDYVFGFQITRTKPHPCMDPNGPMWTCDAPLCDKHATEVGRIFMCPEPGPDSIDRCPLHLGKDDAKAEPLFEADAEFLRRQAHAELRRMFMRAIGNTAWGKSA